MATLVTDMLDRVARQVSIDSPDSWLTATADEYAEIRDDFLDETVRDILDRVDVPQPIAKIYTLTGDGSETYDLPNDFLRLQRDKLAVYETTTVRRAMLPAVTDGWYTHLKEIGSTGADRYYQVRGSENNSGLGGSGFTISIYREPASAISVEIHYISKAWINNSGSEKTAFTNDSDYCLLPRRLVESGIVARWRDRKGLDPTGKMREYENLLGRYANESRGRRSITFGDPGSRIFRYPPPPDEIPTS